MQQCKICDYLWVKMQKKMKESVVPSVILVNTHWLNNHGKCPAAKGIGFGHLRGF